MLVLLLVARADPVVFAFTSGDYVGWQQWDWDLITHLGFWTEPSDDVRAQANKSNVKLFTNAGTPDKKDWTDKDKRKAFAQQSKEKIADKKLDGIFFDYEGNGLSKDEKAAYTALAQEVAAAIAPAKLMVCVGGRPTYELRDYDYAGLAAASDFLFIMGYDLHLWDDYTCMKTSEGNVCSPAEASIRSLKAGVHEYLADVPADKLVLGLPWYGQRYTQIAAPINEGQIKYSDVLKVMDAGKVKNKVLDRDSETWTLTCHGACEDKKKGGKIWIDDAKTLTPKFQLAGQNKLRGVGVWEIDNCPAPDGTGDPHKAEREAMWAALKGWQDAAQVTLV